MIGIGGGAGGSIVTVGIVEGVVGLSVVVCVGVVEGPEMKQIN